MRFPIFIVHSEIVDYELNSPFTYIRQVIDKNHSAFDLPVSSTWVRLVAQVLENRSTDDVERFLSLIPFENREKMEGLGLDLFINQEMEFESSLVGASQ